MHGKPVIYQKFSNVVKTPTQPQLNSTHPQPNITVVGLDY